MGGIYKEENACGKESYWLFYKWFRKAFQNYCEQRNMQFISHITNHCFPSFQLAWTCINLFWGVGVLVQDIQDPIFVLTLNLTGWHLQVRRCMWNRILYWLCAMRIENPILKKKLHEQIHTQSISFCASKAIPFSQLAWPRVKLIGGWVY